MRTIFFTLAVICLSVFNAQGQTNEPEAVLAEVEEISVTQKSEYELKLEEKEAKKTVKALKKRNKMERTVLKLKTKQRTDGIKLEKLNARRKTSAHNLSEVAREKLELKVAKLEMKMAKDKAKMEKLEHKLLKL